MSFTVLVGGLRFPEGPIALSDGSVLLVEMFRPALTRVAPNGDVQVVATIPGGPNGAAVGPDGSIFVCNNGAAFAPLVQADGGIDVAYSSLERYVGGSIDVVERTTGTVRTLYRSCAGVPLRAPNDLVFDANGGFYFTDLGYPVPDIVAASPIYYAQADGSGLVVCVAAADGPNGIGLSPDGKRLYWAETMRGRLMVAELGSHGVAKPGSVRLLYQFPAGDALNSLAIDGAGNVCVAVLGSGAIAVVSPLGELLVRYATGDSGTTNICFGGVDLQTAFVTLGRSGQLVHMAWPWPGMALAHTR